MDYEWDSAKARGNLQKHGIDFADAVTALEDERALTRADPDSGPEERFICLGSDAKQRLLVTVFTVRTDHIRIISARRASRGERRAYEEI